MTRRIRYNIMCLYALEHNTQELRRARTIVETGYFLVEYNNIIPMHASVYIPNEEITILFH